MVKHLLLLTAIHLRGGIEVDSSSHMRDIRDQCQVATDMSRKKGTVPLPNARQHVCMSRGLEDDN